MNVDLTHFQDRIETELMSLNESLAQATTDSGAVMLDQSSVGRLSRMDAMQQQAMAQGMRERLLLNKRKLQFALARIEAGNFGQCCQCDADIGVERLDIDPSAVFCFDCMVERGKE